MRDSPKRSYDAFISYAHENRDTVEWLANRLRNYWVPFKGRRRLFFDRSSVTARPLQPAIDRALSESRFLIVCASRHAVKSDWVEEEIAMFRRHHGNSRILACRVGDLADNALPNGLPPGLYLPDFRGDPTNTSKTLNHSVHGAFLSLLAPLVGMEDKTELSDFVLRRRLQLALGGTGLLVCCTLALLGRSWWLETPNGMRYSAAQDILRAAETTTFDSPYLIDTVRAIASDGREAVEVFAGFYNADTFAPLALAAGYASLHPPACGDAQIQLQRAESDTVRIFPKAALAVASRCASVGLEIATPVRRTFTDDARWARQLAAAGFFKQARRTMVDAELAGELKFGVLIELQAAGEESDGEELSDAIFEWKRSVGNDGDVLWSIVDSLAQLDLARQLNSPAARLLLDIASDAFLGFEEEDYELTNTWSRVQQVVAHLAGAGRTANARILLSKVSQTPSPFGVSHNPEGWAWRGLALSRLNLCDEAAISFARAEKEGLAPIPQSRTWLEWRTIMQSYAMAGQWRAAFRAAKKPPDPRANLELQMYAMELWERLGGGKERSGCI